MQSIKTLHESKVSFIYLYKIMSCKYISSAVLAYYWHTVISMSLFNEYFDSSISLEVWYIFLPLCSYQKWNCFSKPWNALTFLTDYFFLLHRTRVASTGHIWPASNSVVTFVLRQECVISKEQQESRQFVTGRRKGARRHCYHWVRMGLGQTQLVWWMWNGLWGTHHHLPHF